jgi:hypothetical protein
MAIVKTPEDRFEQMNVARPAVVRAIAMALVACLALPAASASAAGPADKLERKAKQADRIIKRRHLPYGTIFDPRFESTTSKRIIGYTHAGDSAIWTGHYIAAQALRYAVTRSGKSRTQVRRTLVAVERLIDVTGSEILARSTAPIGSEWEAAIREGNPDHLYTGTLAGVDHLWHGNTSRDQYSGIFFGLSLVWEHFPQPSIRDQAAELVTRLLEKLLSSNWTLVMPDGKVSTTFLQRPDQQLAFLQIGRQVNPARFAGTYESYRNRLGTLVSVPISLETTDPHGSYFKFNLDAINLLHLIRLEDTNFYSNLWTNVWRTLYGTVGPHGNAHFAAIDRWIEGPDADRDAAIVQMLLDWLKRPRRDVGSDVSGRYPACDDNRACDPVPVVDRPTTDFLWQRSPFVLAGGGDGRVEGPALDLTLPYWMARYLEIL